MISFVNEEAVSALRVIISFLIYFLEGGGKRGHVRRVTVLLALLCSFLGQHSLLQYDILPGPGYEKFRMNLDSGELLTTVSLDRETQEVYSIKGNSMK